MNVQTSWSNEEAIVYDEINIWQQLICLTVAMHRPL